MFFYKKHRHKGKNKKNKGKCYDTSNCIKEKKRFGLTTAEMSELVFNMMQKPKIPIEFIN